MNEGAPPPYLAPIRGWITVTSAITLHRLIYSAPHTNSTNPEPCRDQDSARHHLRISKLVYRSSVVVVALRGRTQECANYTNHERANSHGGNNLHVFFCRFRVPAPVVLVDGVLDRETFVVAFSSFCTSSIARFYHTRVRIARGSEIAKRKSHLSPTGGPLLDPIHLLSLGLLLNHT